jgi:hypothetical protein
MAKKYDDHILQNGREAIADIDRDMRQMQTRYNDAVADGDSWSAKEALRGYNSLNMERERLVKEGNDYYAKATTPAKPLTGQEMMHMDDSRLADPNIMNQTREWMMGQSKYWNKADWNDPEVQQRVREGQEKHALLRRSKEYWG